MNFASEMSSVHLQYIYTFMPEQMSGNLQATFTNFLKRKFIDFDSNFTICSSFYGSNFPDVSIIPCNGLAKTEEIFCTNVPKSYDAKDARQ